VACPILVLIIYLKRKETFLEHKKKTEETRHIRVWKTDHQKLKQIKTRVGFKNFAWVIHKLLEEQAKNLASVEAVMKGTVPVVLTGKPYCGKTTFVMKKLLPALKNNPVLVVDSWNEYDELSDIQYGFYNLNFKDFNEHMRFVPNTQSKVGMIEVENLFAHLDMMRQEMSNWIIIVEEAHSYKNVSAFTKFLYGSRHIVRKMVAITPQTDAFQGLLTLTIIKNRNVNKLC